MVSWRMYDQLDMLVIERELLEDTTCGMATCCDPPILYLSPSTMPALPRHSFEPPYAFYDSDVCETLNKLTALVDRVPSLHPSQHPFVLVLPREAYLKATKADDVAQAAWELGAACASHGVRSLAQPVGGGRDGRD